MNQFFDIQRDIKLHKTYHGGPYVNFVVGDEDESKDLNCLENGVRYYLLVYIFCVFFIEIFDKDEQCFDIVGPDISYNQEEQRVIIERLRKNQIRFENIRSSKDFLALSDSYNKPLNTPFIDFLESKNIEIDWEKHWETILKQLREVNEELIDIIQKCIDEKKHYGFWECRRKKC